jgi:uncharacterized protein YjbI with pentapeptide repeats
MSKYSEAQLSRVLKSHSKWLEGGGVLVKGQCLNLTYENLSGANLIGANLKSANLSGANLEGANLSGANLEGAALTCSED